MDDRGDIQEHLKTLPESELKDMFRRFNMVACSMVLVECETCKSYKPCECDFKPWCDKLTWEWFDSVQIRDEKRRKVACCPSCQCEKIGKFCSNCGIKLV